MYYFLGTTFVVKHHPFFFSMNFVVNLFHCEKWCVSNHLQLWTRFRSYYWFSNWKCFKETLLLRVFITCWPAIVMNIVYDLLLFSFIKLWVLLFEIFNRVFFDCVFFLRFKTKLFHKMIFHQVCLSVFWSKILICYLTSVQALEWIRLRMNNLSNQTVLIHDSKRIHVHSFAGILVVMHDLIHWNIVHFAHLIYLFVTMVRLIWFLSVTKAIIMVVHLW